MKVLILGSGGREHAFTWKIRQSPLCEAIYILPGNGGTDSIGINLKGSPNDFLAVKNAVLSYEIDLVLVGPEEPLILGIHDFFLSDPALKNIPVIGPRKLSAQLEGSKDFSKRFMNRHGIPTASHKTFYKGESKMGLDYLRKHSLPIVIKADGLASGKGVIICENHDQASKIFLEILDDGVFGPAGDKVVIEEFLEGNEISIFVLTDGKSYKILPEAKDYKKIGEGDTGPNTGGMGSVSPVPFYTAELKEKINSQIILPTLEGMREEGIEYFGFLFIGLMICKGEPYVIEYNVRMGDPETQSVIPRMEGDFLEILIALADKKLDSIRLNINADFVNTVVSVSEGYPGVYQKNYPLTIPISIPDQVFYFQAGTEYSNEVLITQGGRVISTTAKAENPQKARELALEATQKIKFIGQYFRRDIGLDLL